MNAPVSPLSFTFSGGTNAFALTQASALPIESFEFSTDADGNIIGWAIQLATDSGSNGGCTAKDFVCPGPGGGNSQSRGYQDRRHPFPSFIW